MPHPGSLLEPKNPSQEPVVHFSGNNTFVDRRSLLLDARSSFPRCQGPHSLDPRCSLPCTQWPCSLHARTGCQSPLPCSRLLGSASLDQKATFPRLPYFAVWQRSQFKTEDPSLLSMAPEPLPRDPPHTQELHFQVLRTLTGPNMNPLQFLGGVLTVIGALFCAQTWTSCGRCGRSCSGRSHRRPGD